LVASDGGIFSFGDAAYYGSEPGDGTNVDNSVGIEASSSGDGYWVAGADGRVGTFGDATPEGSMLGLGLNKPIVAFASIPAELAAPSLSITNLTMPNATTGSPYSASLDAIGGTSPYSWSVESGSLPPGLSLSTTGTITGTPSTQGSSTFSVKVTDSTTPTFRWPMRIFRSRYSRPRYPPPPLPTGQATYRNFAGERFRMGDSADGRYQSTKLHHRPNRFRHRLDGRIDYGSTRQLLNIQSGRCACAIQARHHRDSWWRGRSLGVVL
jgi:hypothetical protein